MNDTCTIIDALQERFSKLPSQCSKEQPMFDAQGREYLVVYRTIPTSLDGKKGAIASNLPDFRMNKEYLQDFQARDLSSIGEASKIRKIAQRLDPTRLLVASGDPTLGAPVVWTSPQGKSYVLGGNGRTIAFLLASDDRYKDYVNEASQRWFNVYDTTQKKGYRNLLVRDVYKRDGSSLTIKEAVKLAGASQESTAGKETPLRQALSRARGMGITKDTQLGVIVDPIELSPYTVDNFVDKNKRFFDSVLELVPDYIRSQISNIDDSTKPIAYDVISSVLVGRYLPTQFVTEGFGNDKEEDAVIGVLPSLIALQQAVNKGTIMPEYDLLDRLEPAREFMQRNRWKSYGKALEDYVYSCREQSSLFAPQKGDTCMIDPLGVAFGLYLKRMVQACDAKKGVSDINKYIDEARKDQGSGLSSWMAMPEDNDPYKAFNLFRKYALPSTLGEKLAQTLKTNKNPDDQEYRNQQNRQGYTMSKDTIIIEALPSRFLSLEEGSKGKEQHEKLVKKLKNDWGNILHSYLRMEEYPSDIPNTITFIVYPFKYKNLEELGDSREYALIEHPKNKDGFSVYFMYETGKAKYDWPLFVASYMKDAGEKIGQRVDPESYAVRKRGLERRESLKYDQEEQEAYKTLIKEFLSKIIEKKSLKDELMRSKSIESLEANFKDDLSSLEKTKKMFDDNLSPMSKNEILEQTKNYFFRKYDHPYEIPITEKYLFDYAKQAIEKLHDEVRTEINKISLEEGSKPKEESLSLKPYRVAPSVADILFIHDSDGTQIQLQTIEDKSRFKEIQNIIRRNASHRGWNYSRNLGSLVPYPRASRANIGKDHPQQWFISNWANVARGLLKDDLQVFVYEEIDPKLDNSYLLEEETDLDALLAHLASKKSKEDKIDYEGLYLGIEDKLPDEWWSEQSKRRTVQGIIYQFLFSDDTRSTDKIMKDVEAIYMRFEELYKPSPTEKIEAEDSKEIIISPAFPRCRYMKGVLHKKAYADAPYKAKKIKCPEGTFLVEQNSPINVMDYLYRYLNDLKKEDEDFHFYRLLKKYAHKVRYEGQYDKDFPLSSPYYIKLLKTYYETLGYDVCRTNIKGGVDNSGAFMIYLEENEELSDSGYGSKYLKPIVYIPFPTKRDLLFFTESQVNEWIDLAKTKKEKAFFKYMDFSKNYFSLPVSSILTFQLHDDDTFSYFYSFEVLGVFQANVINHKEDIMVFKSIGFDGKITEYPNVSVTTDPEDMSLVDKALQACKEVSEEYREKKKALDEKKPKRKAPKSKTVTIYNMKDGELKSHEEKASLLGKQFAVIKRGKAGTYNYPYILVYIPTGQSIVERNYIGGSSEMKYKKLGEAKEIFEGLEKGFIAPKEYPKGYVIDGSKNKEDQVFIDAMNDAFKKY